jgi:ATP-binding cassette subfamily B (MDR/TAP) protein 1
MAGSPRSGSPAGEKADESPEIATTSGTTAATSIADEKRSSLPTMDPSTASSKETTASGVDGPSANPSKTDLSRLDSKIAQPPPQADVAKNDDDLYAHLPENQASILKRQVFTPEVKAGAALLYRYSSRNDIIIMVVSTICAIASGAALPLMTILFGQLQGTFASFFTGQSDYDEFVHTMSRFVLYFVYLAIGEFVTTYIATVGFICEFFFLFFPSRWLSLYKN